ncbi:hypothetical protein QR680_011989 [Steinernema hermaphroditum]|uniref:MULE transposase domain-containing protein n=1 Tax=Steinernema hermaphroditum TaxID=289476 RepID=A0AA39I0H8_9BILA|nr:hypothetical protein QR680_011989 [Steinernema hermaphroditum]
MDYERAAMNAFSDAFPGIKMDGCLFHLTKNMRKHLGDHHLLTRYGNDGEFALNARKIISLAFLPPTRIEDALLHLEDTLPQDLIPILSWFEDNYVGRPTRSGRRQPALFPIVMWSVYARTKDGTDRTNNYSEAAHRRIQAEFQMQHPTIWKFIDALRQVQASRDTAYEAMVRGDPPPKKRKLYQLIDERLLRIITNFDESEPDGNIEEFLRRCAHNFQMDP